jgi:hypothetical protein
MPPSSWQNAADAILGPPRANSIKEYQATLCVLLGPDVELDPLNGTALFFDREQAPKLSDGGLPNEHVDIHGFGGSELAPIAGCLKALRRGLPRRPPNPKGRARHFGHQDRFSIDGHDGKIIHVA